MFVVSVKDGGRLEGMKGLNGRHCCGSVLQGNSGLAYCVSIESSPISGRLPSLARLYF